MADMNDDTKPKKGKVKLILLLTLPLLLGGGGAAAYGMQAGWFEVGGKTAENNLPQLVLKGPSGESPPRGAGAGGDANTKYASTYYALEKEFTSNLQDSVHFVQVGVAISTAYDTRVIENIKKHEIAIRSAVLMALGETSEEQVFTAEGKKQMQGRLAAAINTVLKDKEGFGGVGNVYFTNFIVQ